MTATLPAISEKEFMAQLVGLATIRGWLCFHSYDSRKSVEGFPDLVCVRPGGPAPKLIVAELKKGNNILGSSAVIP